jgi:hypothetical protein
MWTALCTAFSVGTELSASLRGSPWQTLHIASPGHYTSAGMSTQIQAAGGAAAPRLAAGRSDGAAGAPGACSDRKNGGRGRSPYRSPFVQDKSPWSARPAEPSRQARGGESVMRKLTGFEACRGSLRRHKKGVCAPRQGGGGWQKGRTMQAARASLGRRVCGAPTRAPRGARAA